MRTPDQSHILPAPTFIFSSDRPRLRHRHVGIVTLRHQQAAHNCFDARGVGTVGGRGSGRRTAVRTSRIVHFSEMTMRVVGPHRGHVVLPTSPCAWTASNPRIRPRPSPLMWRAADVRLDKGEDDRADLGAGGRVNRRIPVSVAAGGYIDQARLNQVPPPGLRLENGRVGELGPTRLVLARIVGVRPLPAFIPTENPAPGWHLAGPTTSPSSSSPAPLGRVPTSSADHGTGACDRPCTHGRRTGLESRHRIHAFRHRHAAVAATGASNRCEITRGPSLGRLRHGGHKPSACPHHCLELQIPDACPARCSTNVAHAWASCNWDRCGIPGCSGFAMSVTTSGQTRSNTFCQARASRRAQAGNACLGADK